VKDEKLEEVNLCIYESALESLILNEDAKIKQHRRSCISKTYAKR
jgi:hypothetical protein